MAGLLSCKAYYDLFSGLHPDENRGWQSQVLNDGCLLVLIVRLSALLNYNTI